MYAIYHRIFIFIKDIPNATATKTQPTKAGFCDF